MAIEITDLLAIPRQEVEFEMRDQLHGRVNVRIIDRVNIDDVVVHFMHRELFRLVGGDDPDVDVNQTTKDFLIRENFLQR